MPIGLIVFGDKSDTDLHGALSLTLIIFMLTFFNRVSRNNTNIWRPLAYTRNKIQNEHTCLPIAFQSLREIHRNGGFKATVMGREVRVKVWIHFFIGDTEGNNKWLGHYPGNRKEISQPYPDCQCNFLQLSNTNSKCVYTTLYEMHKAKRLKRENEKEGLLNLKNIS